jgi:hypothetical protein
MYQRHSNGLGQLVFNLTHRLKIGMSTSESIKLLSLVSNPDFPLVSAGGKGLPTKTLCALNHRCSMTSW